MSKHAVGVMNGNFRAGDYYRYAQSVSGSSKSCPECGKPTSGLPMYLVGKTDLCYSCYEAEKVIVETYGPNWEADADQVHELLHAVVAASALEAVDEQAEIQAAVQMFGGEHTIRPTYDELIAGAKFTDEHRAEVRQKWNEMYSDEAVQERINARMAEDLCEGCEGVPCLPCRRV